MNRILGAVCALMAVAAGAAVAIAGNSTDPLVAAPRSPEIVPTPTAALSCPESPATKQTQTRMIAVTPAEGAQTSSADGSAEVSVLAQADPVVLEELSSPAIPALLRLTPGDQPAAVVRATGVMAPGLSAAQWSASSKNAGNGLAASQCLAPGDDWTFGGVSTAVGATSRLVVSNPTPAVAVFDLEFYGPEGKVDAVGARGLALASQTQESFDLAQFAPGVDAMAMRLTVESGRVVAAVRTDLVVGNDANGSEWIPPSEAPATEVVVNPAYPKGTDQQLQVANLSDREALVQVQIVTESGPFAPSKLQDLEVAPYSVLTKKLADITDDDAAGVHVTSTAAVIATVVEHREKTEDFAVTSSSPAIEAPAVIPIIDGADLTLALTSDQRASGKVTVAAYGRDGSELSSTSFNFKGFTTKLWEPNAKTLKQAAYLLLSLPVDLDLHGVAQFSRPDGVTSLPITSGIVTLSKPSVQPATAD
jgi:hypothetical protein